MIEFMNLMVLSQHEKRDTNCLLEQKKVPSCPFGISSSADSGCLLQNLVEGKAERVEAKFIICPGCGAWNNDTPVPFDCFRCGEPILEIEGSEQ